MKWNITYRNCTTKSEYTLGGVEADNYNEAVKIAKKYRGPDEEIAGIEWNMGGTFAWMFNAFFGGLAK